jgi:hypothetical protein
LTFPGGCIADITANRVAPQFTRTIQCWSDANCLHADLTARTVTSFSPGGAILEGELPFELVQQGRASAAQLKPEIFGRFLTQETFSGSDEDALTAELQSFLECIRSNRPPLVSGAQGLAALRVAEGILKSIAEHCWDGRPDGRRGPDALIEFHLNRGGTAGRSESFAA